VIWQGLGLQDLNAAAAAAAAAAAPPAAAAAERGFCMEAGGTVWTPFEFLLLPHIFAKSLYDLFAFLPHTVWEVGSKRVRGLLANAAAAAAAAPGVNAQPFEKAKIT
jgi:hypothetical protein